MVCGNCGRTLDNDEKFCAVCGTRVVHSEPEQDSVTQENSNNQQSSVVKETSAFCGFCGSPVDTATGVCPVCGVGSVDVPKKGKFGVLKKFLTAKNIIRIAAVVVVIVLACSIFPYAKNAFMKLILPSDKYFAYVVGDNSDDMVDVFTETISIAKDFSKKGSSVESELSLEVGKGLENLLSDAGVGYAYDSIDWVESAKINLNVNSKDKKFSANVGGKLNGVNFGEADIVFDTEIPAVYASAKDYLSDYIGVEMDDTYTGGYDEATEMMQELMGAMPDKRAAKKLMTRYAKTVVTSVNDVEEESDTIEANGVSQKVTALSFDINEELAKDIAVNVLTELQNDDEMHKIVDEVADVTDMDADDFWNMVDEGLEEMEGADVSDATIGTFCMYVNAKGEVVGFSFSTKGAELNAYVAEKGNKYGLLVEFTVGTGVRLEGGGTSFGNKKSGEFTLEAAGMELVKFDVKKLDTKKLKNGIFNGSVTITCGKGIGMINTFASMNGYDSMGSEIDMLIGLLDDLSLTIKSSSKSLKDVDYTISLGYKEEECFTLNTKSKMKNGKRVKVPKNYIDINDSDAEDIIDEFNFDKLIDKMQDANMPSELIEVIEDI